MRSVLCRQTGKPCSGLDSILALELPAHLDDLHWPRLCLQNLLIRIDFRHGALVTHHRHKDGGGVACGARNGQMKWSNAGGSSSGDDEWTPS